MINHLTRAMSKTGQHRFSTPNDNGPGLLERWRGKVVDAGSLAGGLAAKLLQGMSTLEIPG